MKYCHIIPRTTLSVFASFTYVCGVTEKELQPVIAQNQQHLGVLRQNVDEQL